MFHQTSNPSRFLTNLASILVKKDTKETILEPRNKNSFSWLATTTSTTAITSTSSQTNNPTSSSPITQSTSQRNISDTHFSIGTPSNDNEDGDDDDGVLISTSALIAIISSLSILLLLIILFLAMSICLRYYRKKEEARLLNERVRRAPTPSMLPLTTIPMAQQSQFYKHQNIEDDDYAYRVTQIVDEPKKKKNPVARSRPSKKKSRRVSSKTYSISTDSGTELASSPQPLRLLSLDFQVQNYPEDCLVWLWCRPVKALMPWVDKIVATMTELKSSNWIAQETRSQAANGNQLEICNLQEEATWLLHFQNLMIFAIEQ